MRRFVLAAALLAAACSPDTPSGQEDAEPTASAEPVAPVPATAVPGRAFRYTTFGNCRELRREDEEMPFVEVLCEGVGGYALKVSDSDLRQNVTVVAPGGRETSLDLSATGGGGFSSLGPRAEWRGPAHEPFTPDALVLRYQVSEGGDGGSDVSYLLPVRLAPTPCVTGKVAPGPDQNERARTLADAHGACAGS